MGTLTKTEQNSSSVPVTSDLNRRILRIVEESEVPLSPSAVAARLSSIPPGIVAWALRNLTEANKLFVTKAGKLTLSDPNATHLSKFTELTIQLPPGAIKALRQYAKDQGTSVELEASHLLGEIIRLYKAQSVITTK